MIGQVNIQKRKELGGRTMPRTKEKPKEDHSPRKANGNLPEVLTLAEAAKFLRVPENEILRLVGPNNLPGRQIGSEWRFLKSALRDWLANPPKPSSKEALLSLAGAWKDDPQLDELVRKIYQDRGRPVSEDDE
jgi:excisionase family DNA binding protein